MDLKKINMGKIRDFLRTSPILFSLGFTLLAILVHEAFSNFFYYLLPDTVGMNIVSELMFIIWPLALVMLFGFSFIFRRRGIRAALGAALPKVLLFGTVLFGDMLSLLTNPATDWKSGPEIFLGVLMLIGVGFREEILYRGVITNAIARKYGGSKKGLWITALSAGAMFGAMHIANVFHNVSFEGALLQALSAFGSGVYYCAVYLRSGSIWGVAFLHSLVDAAGAAEVLLANGLGDLTSVIEGTGLQAVIYIGFDLLLAAFLLRKSKRQKIFDRIQQLKSSEIV